MLKEITPNQYEEIIDYKGTGLIVIGAETCKVCSSMKPVFDAVLDNTNIKVVKLDSDKYEDYIKAELFINTFPTFMIVKNGEVVGELSGEQTVDNLVKLVQRIID